MRKSKFTLIEVLATLGISVILIVAIRAVVAGGCKIPQDYHYDPMTDTTTWTDEDGRKMIKSPDGSVRELSK